MSKATTNLAKAFADLRKQGLFARQNYQCCQGCGWAAASLAIEARLNRGSRKQPVMGCVFYHAQDAESLRDGRDFYLAYGGVGGGAAGDVGHLVVQTLAQHGVATEWDGNHTNRILVKAHTVREVEA